MMLKRQKGLAATELTLALPIILFILLIAIDYGRVAFEVITTSGAARASAAYGAYQQVDLSSAIDEAAIKTVAQGEATNLTIHSGETDAITTQVERLCRCYDPTIFAENKTFLEPTAAACTAACSEHLEVYIQTTTTRTFKTISGFPLLPKTLTFTRVARMRAQ
ncbi:pilus assembly protein [Vibrio sp. JC009]|uniref:TadE/TadG family type IV pilus assembly protein n=1 Tax=Vibrio sp. JC009 TaxID=2912314 RepID=UPI0023B0C6D4|nr:TadE/TadG family type IV pilus assembly protein [Vibrio sp. JC009]WED21224.1 pilus assembly protein [Vibrio sp. JC009]